MSTQPTQKRMKLNKNQTGFQSKQQQKEDRLTGDSSFLQKKRKKKVVDKLNSSAVCRVNPTSSDVVLTASYKKAWNLLKGHTVSPGISAKVDAVVFDGKLSTVKKLNKVPRCTSRPGIFVTKQSTLRPGWGKNDVDKFVGVAIEFDDGKTEKEQIERVKNSGMQYTMMTHSGGKSVHTLTLFDKPVPHDEIKYIQHSLATIFPDADKAVTNGEFMRVRCPIESSGYSQRLIEVRDKVNLKKFMRWLEKALNSSVRNESDTLSSEGVKEFEKYWELQGKKSRVSCPVCENRGRNNQQGGKNDNLSAWLNNDGEVRYNCFRCRNYEDDRKDLAKYFESKRKVDPNHLIKLVQHELRGKFFWSKEGLPFSLVGESEYLFVRVPIDEVRDQIFLVYQKCCEQLRQKESDSDFRKILELLKLKNRVVFDNMDSHLIPFQDGSAIDLSQPKKIFRVEEPTNFFLPINLSDWKKKQATPVFSSYMKRHFNEEDRKVLYAFLGYIFSNEPVSYKQVMLIVNGVGNTGKSQLLEFVERVLSSHSVRSSVTDCLAEPAVAANILGKRVAIASEVTLHAKQSSKFKSLISGESVLIHAYYVGKSVVKHNTVFLAATNDEAWLQDSQEMRKRIRVVLASNPVTKKEMDPDLCDKFYSERVGIIKECLEEFGKIGNEFPFNKSSVRYMDVAGANFNKVKGWLLEYKIKRGTKFIPTRNLYERFIRDTSEKKISFNEFSKQFKAEFQRKYGDSPSSMKTYYRIRKIQGKEKRGYLIDRGLK